jgi:hypothetical protein
MAGARSAVGRGSRRAAWFALGASLAASACEEPEPNPIPIYGAPGAPEVARAGAGGRSNRMSTGGRVGAEGGGASGTGGTSGFAGASGEPADAAAPRDAAGDGAGGYDAGGIVDIGDAAP